MTANNAVLARPGAGQSEYVTVGPAARLELIFKKDEAVLGKEEQNLVFIFDDGGKLVLEGFYDHCPENGQPPTLVFWHRNWNAGYWS